MDICDVAQMVISVYESTVHELSMKSCNDFNITMKFNVGQWWSWLYSCIRVDEGKCYNYDVWCWENSDFEL